MAKNNLVVKVFAFLALFGIIVGIIATGVLFIISSGDSNNINNIDREIKIISQPYDINNSGSLNVTTGTGN